MLPYCSRFARKDDNINSGHPSWTLAIAKRKGAGKLGHINVSALWYQNIQGREGAQYLKIDDTRNPADLVTKYLNREKMDLCMASISQEVRIGRPTAGLDAQGASSKTP